jgi:O-antigen/teichoic acid export membrane protein
VTRQGIWVFLSSIFSSGLGFAFWVVAARLFSAEDVGIGYSLVALASLATGLATLGLDIGFVRFAPRVREPLRLLRSLLIITGCLGVVVGGILPLALLFASHLEAGALFILVGINIFLTVTLAWNDLTNGAIMAAQKSHILTIANASYGLIKLAAVILVIGMGAVGLTAAYAFPAAILLLINFSAIRHLWPAVNPGAEPHSIRALAPISTGNWISGFAYSLPARLGPSLMLLFLPAASVAYFSIALALAEVLNYMSEAFSKSLFAHGSRKDRLTHSITSHVRGLLSLILIPAVAIGIVAAPFVLWIVGGAAYQAHYLALQLFLLATIPRGFYQILKAQFNVEQRPGPLIASGATLGISTVGFLLVGLILHVDLNLLPVSWILGGLLGLAVGQSMASKKRSPRAAAVNGR